MLSVGFKERNMHQHLQIYLNQQHINLIMKGYLVGKTLICNLWIVDESVGNKYVNGFTNEQNTSKKKLSVLFRWYIHR